MTSHAHRPSRPAPWLRTARATGSTLVVDYRTGVVTMLGGQAKRVWDCYQTEQPCGADEADQKIIDDLTARGWLTTAAPPASPGVIELDDSATSWGTQETAAALPAIGATPWFWRLAAGPAVLTVILVRQLRPQRRFARLLWLTRLGAELPLATDRQARHAICAVRRAARLIPAKVACLEESVAAALLLAAIGKRVTWCHGIATNPVRLHAWIADRNGDPIEEPANTARYTIINQP